MKFDSRKLSIYGEFWLRYLYWGARNTPMFLEPLILFGFVSMFFLLCSAQRRGIAANLRFVFPRASRLGILVRTFRVFWNYAWTLDDLAHTRCGEKLLCWEVAGIRYLDELETSQQGAILMTAHMGNYDVAAPIFSARCRRPIHMVRTPERQTESRVYQDQYRDQEQSATFFIHYNEPGNMLGVELTHCLNEGALVAIQGDRVLFDVSPFWIPYQDAQQSSEWRLPRGPFLLASVAKAPIYPIFIIRRGYRRYRIEAHAPLEVSSNRERGRDATLRDAAIQWSRILSGVVQRHWRQWFVFEPVFRPSDPSQEASPGASDASPDLESPPTDLEVPPADGASVIHPYAAAAAIGLGWWLMLFMALAQAWGAAIAVGGAILLWFPTLLATLHLSNGLNSIVCHLLRIHQKRQRFSSGLICIAGGTLLALRWVWGPSLAWAALGWLWITELVLGALIWALMSKKAALPSGIAAHHSPAQDP